MQSAFRVISHMAVAVTIASFAIACNDKPNTAGPGPVQPQISSVSPAAPQPQAAAQQLRFEGVEFAPGMRLLVTAPDRTTATIGEPQLQNISRTSFDATVVLSQTGTYDFVVESAALARSGTFTVAVQQPGSTLPTISTVTPTSLARTTVSTAVVIAGTGFLPELSVTVVDPSGTAAVLIGSSVSYQSSARVEIGVVFNAPGIYLISVTNPSGETSNAAQILVT